MKWITQDDLVFTMYHGKVYGVSFSVYDDGDIEMELSNLNFVHFETLKLIAEIAEEFVKERLNKTVEEYKKSLSEQENEN